MTNFFKIPFRWALPVAITSLLPIAAAQTITYMNAGVYTNVAPAGVNKVTFKLWGAGGGGGGAFSSVTLDAQPADTFVIVVGQRGAASSPSLGGAGSGGTQGGPPGEFLGSFTNRAQGGQASSVFFMTNDLLVMKAVAGAGAAGAPGVVAVLPASAVMTALQLLAVSLERMAVVATAGSLAALTTPARSPREFLR